MWYDVFDAMERISVSIIDSIQPRSPGRVWSNEVRSAVRLLHAKSIASLLTSFLGGRAHVCTKLHNLDPAAAGPGCVTNFRMHKFILVRLCV